MFLGCIERQWHKTGKYSLLHLVRAILRIRQHAPIV